METFRLANLQPIIFNIEDSLDNLGNINVNNTRSDANDGPIFLV